MRRDPGMLLAVLLGLLFGLAGTGSSAAAVVLPALGADLGVGPGAAAWVISTYALMLAVGTAVHGRVGDLVGLRAPLVAGIGLMAGGALVAAVAPALPLLLAARAVQGAGAAAVPVLASAVVVARYEGAARARALGLVVGMTSAISALGPLVGGALESVGGWRAALALPALALALVPVVWRAAPAEGTGGRLDVRGAVLVTAAAAGLVLLIQSPSAGVAAAVAGAVLLAAAGPLAARHSRRAPEGFLPRAVLRERVVLRAAASAAAVPASWFALLVGVPLALAARGWSPLGTGLALVPAAVVGFAASQASGPVLARGGPLRTLVGSGATAAVALLLAAVGAAAGVPALLVTGVVLVTVAFGVGQPAMVGAVSAAVPEDTRGVALGVATLVFLVGGAVGSAVVGGVGDVLGLPASLLLVAALPVAGVLGLLGPARRTAVSVA